MCFAQNRAIDSLTTLIRTTKEDTTKIKALCELGWSLMYQQIDTSVILANRALLIAEKLTDNKIKNKLTAGINSNLGVYNWLKGDFNAALTFHFISLKLREDLNDKKAISVSLSNLGLVYQNMGNLIKSLEYNFKALRISEELGNKNGISRQYINIGGIYKEQGNYNKSLDYYFKGLKIVEETGNKGFEANVLGNIGNDYVSLSQLENEKEKKKDLLKKGLDYNLKGLKIREELGATSLVATSLGNIALIYAEYFKFDTLNPKRGEYFNKTLEYLNKALRMKEEVGNKAEIATALGNVGTLYVVAKKFKEAIPYLLQSVKLADSIGFYEATKEFNLMLSHAYYKTGNFKMALEHYQQYSYAKDTIYNQEGQKKQTRIEMQYDFDKKQVADSLKNAEQTKIDQLHHLQEIKQQKFYTYGGLIGFVLMIIVSGVSFRAYRQKQKDNSIITQQKELVEEKQKEILDSIRYAKRIQSSLLPPEKYIDKSLKQMMRKNGGEA